VQITIRAGPGPAAAADEDALSENEARMSWTPTTRGVAVLPAAALLLVLGVACASNGGRTVGTGGSAAGGEEMKPGAIPACGDRVDALVGRAGPLAMTGEFPSQVAGSGDGMFVGRATVTSTGPRVSGVTSPEADVFVVRAGEVVSTPLPKDLIGMLVDLGPGASKAFAARGTIRRCAARDSGVGELLPPGRYDVFAVVVVNRDDGSAVAATGGPWPVEVT
jgi:hypothetical protein